jgi:tripartite-type tricarboxylate transporter receptor subunit TctC
MRRTDNSFLHPVRIAAFFAAGLALAIPATSAWADTYPTRPVRIIVPYGAGGIADVTMRLVAQQLDTKLGQQFIIDNRPGAGGIVGLKAASSAAPDGYTLSMIGGGLTIAKSLFKSLPYDLEKDFIPISTTASYGLLVAVNPSSPLHSVADIIAAARATPGKLNFGSINPGSAQNLSAELFRTMAGIDVTMIPYKTTPDLATALMRGDVDVAFEYYAGFQPLIQEHQIGVAATTGGTRADDVVTLLNQAVNDALRQPEVQALSSQFGMEARGSSVEDLRRRIAGDIAKWAVVIDKAGIEKH